MEYLKDLKFLASFDVGDGFLTHISYKSVANNQLYELVIPCEGNMVLSPVDIETFKASVFIGDKITQIQEDYAKYVAATLTAM